MESETAVTTVALQARVWGALLSKDLKQILGGTKGIGQWAFTF